MTANTDDANDPNPGRTVTSQKAFPSRQPTMSSATTMNQIDIRDDTTQRVLNDAARVGSTIRDAMSSLRACASTSDPAIRASAYAARNAAQRWPSASAATMPSAR